jgi:hypothetical protein
VRFVFDLPVEYIRTEASQKRVTFVLNRGGLLEWLIISSWCRAQGMGGVVFANRLRILLLSRPKAFFPDPIWHQDLRRYFSFGFKWLATGLYDGPRALAAGTFPRPLKNS